MNQLYRALHMPPGRLLKKALGHKEIYTIAVRPATADLSEAPLPALGGGAYTPLPETPGWWYADPLLFHKWGRRWLFCEAFNMETGRGSIAVCDFSEQGLPNPPQVVLEERYHLSFPTVFDWNGETWMIPETGENHSLNLYRCTRFPGEWERVEEFIVGRELCDTILMNRTPGALTLLCSETRPDNQLYTRYRKYLLRVDPAAENGFTLEEDEPFNLQHREFGLGNRNAGPLFTHGGQVIRPAQVSTKVDYGVYVQFYALRGDSEIPLCAATPQNLRIEGLEPRSVIGVHTYCRDEGIEVIDARYLEEKPSSGRFRKKNPSEGG